MDPRSSDRPASPWNVAGNVVSPVVGTHAGIVGTKSLPSW